MTEPRNLPYVLRLYVFWLLGQAVDADHVVTDLRHDPDGQPIAYDGRWIEVHSYPGRVIEGGSIHWLEETGLQVSCYAGARHATHELAETVRTLTVGSFHGTVITEFDSAVVSGVRPGGITDDLDPRFTGRQMHRSRFDLIVTAHPDPSTSS